MIKLAILCVDDERIILDSLRIQIEKNLNNKYIFEYAESAEEALEVIDDLIFEGIDLLLVISDYQMPGMKGDEFASWVRINYPGIRVVMITGHMGKEQSKNLLEAQLVERVLQKPWKEEELIELVLSLSPEGYA